jgi:hypothetical protein
MFLKEDIRSVRFWEPTNGDERHLKSDFIFNDNRFRLTNAAFRQHDAWLPVMMKAQVLKRMAVPVHEAPPIPLSELLGLAPSS